MPAAPAPLNETARYTALLSHRLRQSVLGDGKADEMTRAAVRRFGVPQSAIALVGKAVVHFIAATGVGFHTLPRAISFCGYAIHSRDPLIVPDATLDPRFADNPLVTGGPRVRFYAGAPLIDQDGYCLGTFCIVDTLPRRVAPEEIAELVRLSRQAMQRIDFLSTISEMTLLPGDKALA
jgi:GAF domain-containing protein